MNWHPERYKDRWYQELSAPNGGEIPIQVTANQFAVHITMAAAPGEKPPEFKISDYVKNGGNGDGERA